MKIILSLFILSLGACAQIPGKKKSTIDPNEPVSRTPGKPIPPKTNTSGVGTSDGNPSVSPVKNIQTQYSQGNYQTALDQIEATREIQLSDRDRSDLWNIRGLILLRQQNFPEAQRSFERAIEINPVPGNRPYLQYNLAAAYAEAKNYSESEQILDSIPMAGLDSENRRKVFALREKIERAKNEPQNAANKVQTDFPNATTNSVSNTTGSSTDTYIPAPLEKYSGPTHRNRIGVLVPLSGKYQTFGERVLRTVKLAFDDRMDIEIVAEDAGSDLGSHLSAMQKLVEEQQVIAIVGPILSNGLETLIARSAYYQVPLLSLVQTTGPTADNYFLCSVLPKNQIERIVDYAMNEQGMRKFAILAPENRAGNELAFLFWDEVQKREGEIRGFETYSSKLTDFRDVIDPILGLTQIEDRADDLAELARLRAQDNVTKRTRKTEKYYTLKPIIDFDAVFIADEARTVGQIIPTFAYRDATTIKWLGISSWNSLSLIQRAGDFADGAVFPTAFQTVRPVAETKNFIQHFQGALQVAPTEMEALTYDAASVLKSAIAQEPSSREEMISLINKQSQIAGATGSISMTNRTCTRELKLLTVRKGKFSSL